MSDTLVNATQRYFAAKVGREKAETYVALARALDDVLGKPRGATIDEHAITPEEDQRQMRVRDARVAAAFDAIGIVFFDTLTGERLFGDGATDAVRDMYAELNSVACARASDRA